jgi:hypothetical protein
LRRKVKRRPTLAVMNVWVQAISKKSCDIITTALIRRIVQRCPAVCIDAHGATPQPLGPYMDPSSLQSLLMF